MQNSKLVLALAVAGLTSGCGAAVTESDVPAAQAVDVAVQPSTATVQPAGNVAFAAAVTGAVDTGVTWTVLETGGGTIDTAGKYVAPASTGSFHVVATSKADPTKSAQASVTVTAAPAPPSPGVSPTAMELISRSVPATSSGGKPSDAQDNVYGGPLWGGHVCQLSADKANATGAWLTYDLSGVPAAKRTKLLVALYMAAGNQYYQLNFRNAGVPDATADTPRAYVLEGAASAAGPWTQLASVAVNCNPFRSHAVDFTGFTFLRLRVTDGSLGAWVKMDVYNAAAGVTDGWVFYGDSITTNAFGDGTFPPEWFSKGVNASASAYFPYVVGGGYPYMTSADAAALIVNGNGNFAGGGLPSPLRSIFSSAKYVALLYGTNDAQLATAATDYRTNMTTLIRALRNQGQTVVVASPPWTTDPGRTSGVVAIRNTLGFHLPSWSARTYAVGDAVWNGTRAYQCTTAGNSVSGPTGTGAGLADGGGARWSYLPTLREDFASDPLVMGGPDLYALFLNHSDWLQDGVHPNGTGSTQWKQAWVSWATTALYR